MKLQDIEQKIIVDLAQKNLEKADKEIKKVINTINDFSKSGFFKSNAKEEFAVMGKAMKRFRNEITNAIINAPKLAEKAKQQEIKQQGLITAALQDSLNKRKGFNEDQKRLTQINTELFKKQGKEVDATVKKEIKTRGLMTVALQDSLNKRKGFNEEKKRSVDITKTEAKVQAKNIIQTQKQAAATDKAAKKTDFWSMNLLTFLFIGQMVQRTFMRIATVSTTAFKDVASANNEAANALRAFAVGFQFLKVTIGEAIASALLPYADTIMNIMTSVADWVSQHEKLTAGIVLGGIALGIFLVAIAQFGLALNSIINLIKIATPFIAGKGGTGLLGAFTKLAAFLGGGSVLAGIALIGAAIAIAVALWKGDVNGFQDFIKTTFGIVSDFVVDTFTTLWDILKLLFGAVGDILAGDFGKGMDKLKLIVIEVVKWIGRTFISLVSLLINALSWMITNMRNMWLGIFQYLANRLISFISWIDGIMGGWSPFTSAMDGLNDFIDALESSKISKAPLISLEATKEVRKGLDDWVESLDAVKKMRMNIAEPEIVGPMRPTSDSRLASTDALMPSILPQSQNITSGTSETQPLTYAPIYNISAMGDKEVKKIIADQNKTMEDKIKAWRASGHSGN